MGTLAAAGAAMGIAAIASMAVWKLARTIFRPSHIVVFGIAAALGWMVLLRAWALPYAPWTDAVQRLTVAGVGTAWFVVIRDAVRSVRADRDD